MAGLNKKAKLLVFLRAGQQYLNKARGVGENSTNKKIPNKTLKKKKPNLIKEQHPKENKTHSQSTQQLGAMFLEIALKYETIEINPNQYMQSKIDRYVLRSQQQQVLAVL